MKRYLIFFAILSIFICGACTKAEMQEMQETPATSTDRTFTISLLNDQGTDTRTPGQHQYNESHIEKADIFFFDNAAGDIVLYPEQSQIAYSTDKITLSLSSTEAAQLFGKNLVLYILGNSSLPREAFLGKTSNEIIALAYENESTLNPSTFTPQRSFLMEGLTAVTNLSDTQTSLGTITLRRAAAKIMVAITYAQIDGYTPLEAALCLNNYLDKTTLSEHATPYTASGSDYKSSDFRPLPLPDGSIVTFADPLYSYANDWRNGQGQESDITVRVKWQHDQTGESSDYYYRIPFSAVQLDPDGQPNRQLKRNYLYTFRTYIRALGGTNPAEPIDLETDFVLRDWTTRNILAELNRYDFLVVSEHEVEMHDISRRLIHYTSSNDITLRLDSAYYYRYESSGDIKRIDLTKTDGDFYPTLSKDGASSNIVVDCAVPTNYVPTHIQFTVISGLLSQKVRVVVYPRQYLTSAFSNRDDIDFAYYTGIGQGSFWQNNANGGTNMKNFNLYTITTTSLTASDDFVLGGDMTASQNFFPNGYMMATKTDEETNRMISPKFVVASQRGIYSLLSYNYAAFRCSLYSEGGYPVGTWRIPTVAEMKLIGKLQGDPLSALNNLFVPANSTQGRWWTARQNAGTYYVYNIATGNLETTTSTSATYAVRCVHDVWKD